MAETTKGTGGMAMETGWLIYRDGNGREYATPYPYTPEVLEETCRRTGWVYAVVPFVPKLYTGYYCRWGGLIYLLDLDAPNKYGFGTKRQETSIPTVDDWRRFGL